MFIYLEIAVDPYPYPISYRGNYYQRSGTTNQELKGAALDRFVMRRLGRTWDGVPIPHLAVDDLDNATFTLFRRMAKHSRRMSELDLAEDNASILDKLRLTEGTYLKRAAALLFHPDPERFVTGAYIKIGYFKEHANLIFQDEVHGNLFAQVRGTIDLLTTKYLRATISYQGIQRIESLPIPEEALREAVLNAVINKNYADYTPIQIRVSDHAVEIVNGGTLPDTWTMETLLSSHRSQPYNPDIAHTFFRAGEIEAWGRGIQRILESCRAAGTPQPEFRCTPAEFWITFPIENTTEPQSNQDSSKEGSKEGSKESSNDNLIELTEKQKIALVFCKKPQAATEILQRVGVTTKTKNRQKYIYDLIEAGLIEMTIPDRPTSRNQRYRTTAKGTALLKAKIPQEDKNG